MKIKQLTRTKDMLGRCKECGENTYYGFYFKFDYIKYPDHFYLCDICFKEFKRILDEIQV